MSKHRDFPFISACRFIWKTIRPHKVLYFAASAIALLLVGTSLLQTRLTQALIDGGSHWDLSAVLRSLPLYLLVIAIHVSLGYVSGISVSKLAARAGRDLKRSISSILLRAQYGSILRLKAGDTLRTLNSDTQNVCSFLSGDLIGLFSQFVLALGALGYLLWMDPLLALVTFAYTPLGMFFTLSLNAKMNRLYPKAADSEGQALSLVEQILTQIPVVKSFTMEARLRRRVHAQYAAVRDTKMEIALPNALLQPACSSTSMIPRILYLIFAGYQVFQGRMTIGALIAVYDLLNYIIGPTVYFPFLLNSLNRSAASANRIRRLESLPQSAQRPLDIHAEEPVLSIKELSFAYEDGKSVLAGLSFAHRGNGIVVVTGPSGSGKTTLLDLIAGLYEPTHGNIRVCGGVSVVTQDTTLFPDTLLNNVRLARPSAANEDVLAACRRAGVEVFALGLSQGYHTPIGDGNGGLSGGQKQRVSLARTLLADRSVWLLDEPTSALDTETEQLVLKAIQQEARRKLIVICAHRPSLIALADRRIAL